MGRGEQIVPIVDGLTAKKVGEWKLELAGISDINRKIAEALAKPTERKGGREVIPLAQKLPGPKDRRCHLRRRAARDANPLAKGHADDVAKLMNA